MESRFARRILILPELRQFSRDKASLALRIDMGGSVVVDAVSHGRGARVFIDLAEHLARRGDVAVLVVSILARSDIDVMSVAARCSLKTVFLDLAAAIDAWNALRSEGVRIRACSSLERLRAHGTSGSHLCAAIDMAVAMTASVTTPRLSVKIAFEDEAHVASDLDVDAVVHTGVATGHTLALRDVRYAGQFACYGMSKPWHALVPGDIDLVLDLLGGQDRRVLRAGYSVDDVSTLRGLLACEALPISVDVTIPVRTPCRELESALRGDGDSPGGNVCIRWAGESIRSAPQRRKTCNALATLWLTTPQKLAGLEKVSFESVIAPGQTEPIFVLPSWWTFKAMVLHACPSSPRGICAGLRAALESSKTSGHDRRQDGRHLQASRSSVAAVDALLSPAEYDIAKLLAYTGLSLKEIASERRRSYHTIRTQSERIYHKLKVHSRPELAVKLRN